MYRGGVMALVVEYNRYCDAGAVGGGGQSMNTEEKRSVIECYVHAVNAFDVETMIALLHPDVEYKSISDGTVTLSASGIEAFRNLAEQGKQIFSSRKQTIMEFYEKGDQVIMEISYVGVLAVDLPDGMHAGDTLNLDGLLEIVLRDEKIYRITEIF